MTDEVERIVDPDSGDEGWQRLTDEPEVRGVEAHKIDDDSWELGFGPLEFVREDPLEAELRQAIHRAVGAVVGVREVIEEDRETMIVGGLSGGESLVRAAAEVLDRFADRIRAHIDSL